MRKAKVKTKEQTDIDSDDVSLETTGPTDISLSADEISGYLADHGRKKLANRHELERKQLIHDMQMLKIELSQKTMLLDNVKAEGSQRIEELEESLEDARHQRQIIQARLDAHNKISHAESQMRDEKIQREMDAIVLKQRDLESTNRRLHDEASQLRRTLVDLELTENEYNELRQYNEEELSLKKYIAVRFYEMHQPLRLATNEAKLKGKAAMEELITCRALLEKCVEELGDEKNQRENAETRLQKMSLAYADTKQLVKAGDYKLENYDKVKKERDELDMELKDIKGKYDHVQAALERESKERSNQEHQLTAARQSITLLTQDKDYFSRQVSDLSNKLMYAEEKVTQLNGQLDRACQSKEEMYEKYVASRDKHKAEYEAKLDSELSQIRLRTDGELDKLKINSREMYERENRNLREARDLALHEKDRAVTSEKELQQQLGELQQQQREKSTTMESRISEMQNEVRLKSFEAERTRLVHEEMLENLKHAQNDNEKLAAKLEVLTKEFFSLQTSSERRVAELEATLGDKMTRLDTYEKLEQELDDVVLQAADMEDEAEAEKVLFSFGYGANVPTTSRRRLKQSVHLAKRVLLLERENTSLKKGAENERNRVNVMAHELKNANDLLDQSQQPYQYLVEGMRVRDDQINKMRDRIQDLETDLRKSTKEKQAISKQKNQMAQDLERLLNHEQDMAVIKQVVQELSESQRNGRFAAQRSRSPPQLARSPRRNAPSPSRSPRAKRQTKDGYVPPQHLKLNEEDENVFKPTPTQFVSKNAPEWYRATASGN